MESYVGIEGRTSKNLTYPYTGGGKVRNGQNHPYVIDKWPLNNENSECRAVNKMIQRHEFGNRVEVRAETLVVACLPAPFIRLEGHWSGGSMWQEYRATS